MRVDWQEFFPLVKQHCDQVPDPVLLTAIRAAACDFCEKSLAYRADFDPLIIIAGMSEYEMDPPDIETRVVTPLYVELDGEKLTETCEDAMPVAWRAEAAGKTKNYLVMAAQSLWLYPTPATASTTGLFIRAALKPTRISTGVEDVLLEDHGETIAHAAVARIMEISKKPWSDAQLAVYHAGKYAESLAVAKLRSRKGNTMADLRVQVRPFI